MVFVGFEAIKRQSEERGKEGKKNILVFLNGNAKNGAIMLYTRPYTKYIPDRVDIRSYCPEELVYERQYTKYFIIVSSRLVPTSFYH